MNKARYKREQATRERDFEALLDHLRRERGFDFSGYKRPSLVRRFEKRMQELDLGGFADYIDYLEVHPEEFAQLFNTVLINVTAFFRDASSWEFLAAQVVPRIIERKKPGAPIRVWSAGCASGEEAYSVAIVLAEALGAEPFRERVKIYASDIDEEALNHARQATYSDKDLQAVDPALREKYFEPQNGRFAFRADLRRAVIFGRHDLMTDAPISRLDLLVCRNTLMYFNAEAQRRILARFHFALNNDGPDGPGGYVFLGRAEMLLTHGNLFTPVEMKQRIFVKVSNPEMRRRADLALRNGNRAGDESAFAAADLDRLKELALEEVPVPRLVVDANEILVHATQKMRLQFSVNPQDIGRPLKDLEISYRPVELRSLIEQAYAERRTVTQTSVERRFPNGDVQYLDVVVAPLADAASNPLGAAVTFLDVTNYFKVQQELQHSKEEIQTVNEELQSSNEELQTTNEELQSTNEELETTNEELHSTNEELETMNEELQSTNEELQTLNSELRERTVELNRTNAFLESVFASLRSGAVVVDGDLNVEVWNDRAADLWGLRADEVRGKSVLNLDIGLPIGQIRDAIRACAAGASKYEESVLRATTRRGKSIGCRITVHPLAGRPDKGAIILMDEVGEGTAAQA